MKTRRKKIGNVEIMISHSKSRQKYELWMIYYKNLRHFKFRLSYLELQIFKSKHVGSNTLVKSAQKITC